MFKKAEGELKTFPFEGKHNTLSLNMLVYKGMSTAL